MSDLDYLKQFRALKDIADIIDEIEKLDRLVCQNEWDEVSRHIQKVSEKHPMEATAYNSRRMPAQSTQQAATGCRQFLVTLGMAKTTEEALKHLGGN